jgi:hypothetical protein
MFAFESMLRKNRTIVTTSIEHITKHEEKLLKFYGGSPHRSRLMKLFKGSLSLQVYKVVVNSGAKSWFIFRRYNEFHTLFEKVS